MNIQCLFPLGLMGLISLLSKGTLKSLLQHHSSKASILQCSGFFMVQLSHRYMTTEKIIAWTIGTFVGKVMSLLFNMLSRFIIAFLPRSKHLLISWLQSLFTIILEGFKNKTNKKGSFHFSLPKRKSFAWVLRNHLIHLWSPRGRGKNSILKTEAVKQGDLWFCLYMKMNL